MLAEHPIGKKFDFEPGDLLNGIPVREVGIPRMTDKDGKQKYNCWGFILEDAMDSIHFKEGDVVDITNISKETD